MREIIRRGIGYYRYLTITLSSEAPTLGYNKDNHQSRKYSNILIRSSAGSSASLIPIAVHELAVNIAFIYVLSHSEPVRESASPRVQSAEYSRPNL